MSADDQATFHAWQNEHVDGALARPWTQPDHPLYMKAIGAIAMAKEDPNINEYDVGAILAEVDRVMGNPKTRRTAPSVLPSGDGKTRKTKGPQLTDDHKKIAAVMYPDLPAAEAIKRYGASKARLEESANAG